MDNNICSSSSLINLKLLGWGNFQPKDRLLIDSIIRDVQYGSIQVPLNKINESVKYKVEEKEESMLDNEKIAVSDRDIEEAPNGVQTTDVDDKSIVEDKHLDESIDMNTLSNTNIDIDDKPPMINEAPIIHLSTFQCKDTEALKMELKKMYSVEVPNGKLNVNKRNQTENITARSGPTSIDMDRIGSDHVVDNVEPPCFVHSGGVANSFTGEACTSTPSVPSTTPDPLPNPTIPRPPSRVVDGIPEQDRLVTIEELQYRQLMSIREWRSHIRKELS